ncbi:TPA: hypothetical protein ACH3X1_007080 [Trebouxia sp. C0004]
MTFREVGERSRSCEVWKTFQSLRLARFDFVQVALHGQEKKEVAAIQLVEDQLSKKEVAHRINKKKSGVKNQAGNKRLNTPANSIPAPAMLYATASDVTTITGAFQKCNEVTSRPTGQGHEGDAPPGGQ